MPEYLHPGVYVEEIPSGSKPIEGVATSVAAFVGKATKGPVGKAELVQSFDDYNHSPYTRDRYHYSAFYASLGMFLVGDEYFGRFFPRTARVLVAHQNRDGSWQPEQEDAVYGNAYTTSLMVLALSVHNQLLPVFQR